MTKYPKEFFPVLTKIGCLLNLLTYRGNTIVGFSFVDCSTCRYKLVNHKYVNYDHAGECSPEKDCLW